MTHDPSVSPHRVVAAPRAPAGASDSTRRWAIGREGHADAFPGLTRPEAERVVSALAQVDAGSWDGYLVEITLPVVLSDGAGPHLLDVAGHITLALGPHPVLDGVHVAMGEAAPVHGIGLVSPDAERLWRWIARRDVVPGAQVTALDALAALVDLRGAREWERGGR